MRIVVTRPLAQAEALVSELRAAGADAVALPLIEIAAPADEQPLRDAWRTLDERALVMFVSANAVQQFMRLRPPSAPWPARPLAGSTGPGTSAALRAAGVPAHQLVEPRGEVFDSEALWQQLRERDWHGQRVLVVRGEAGRDWLGEQLRERGAEIEFIAAYRREPPRLDAAARAVLDAALASPRRHLWALSSSEALRNLQRLAPRADWREAAAVAPHPRIVAQAQRMGFASVRLAPAHCASLAALAREERPIQSPAP